MTPDELKQSPAVSAGALALAMGLLCLLWAFWVGGPTPLRQGLLCSALFLMAFDVLAGTAAMRGPRRPDNPALLVHAFYAGWVVMATGVLAQWQGPAAAGGLFLTWAVGGLVFGAIAAMLPTWVRPVDLPGIDDPSLRITRDRRGRMLYFGWPLLSVLLLAGPLLDTPGTGPGLRSLALPMVIVPFLLSPLRPERGYLTPLSRRLRMIGLGLVAVALVLA